MFLRAAYSFASAVLLLVVPLLLARPAQAAVTFVQGTAIIGTSASLTSTATAGNLLVVICGDNVSSTITGPSGYTQIINQAGTVSQAMFYKMAAGTEKTGIGCTFGGSGTEGVQVLEYSGIHAYNTLEGSMSANGSSTSVSTGTLATTHAADLLVAAAISNSQTTVNWTSPFTNREDAEKTSGGQSSRDAVSSSDQVVGSTGSYSASASAGNAAWRGQIVAFRALASSPALGADIVDAGGSPVGSPSAALSSVTTTFACQTASGTLGTSAQKIHVDNSTDNPAWSLTLAATAGPTAAWSYTGPPAHSYKFNDPGGSGCTSGQMTVNAAAGTVAAGSNCSATSGITKGSSAAFNSGVTDDVTLLSASSPADIDCGWDLTGVSLSQKVPPSQPSGTYSLNMTLTITAN
jgi:hypothetical protein